MSQCHLRFAGISQIHPRNTRERPRWQGPNKPRESQPVARRQGNNWRQKPRENLPQQQGESKSLIDIDQGRWRSERFGNIKNQVTCCFESFPFNVWSAKSLKILKTICVSNPQPSWRSKKRAKPTWWDSLKIPTCAQFTQNESQSCPKTSNSRAEFGGRERKAESGKRKDAASSYSFFFSPFCFQSSSSFWPCTRVISRIKNGGQMYVLKSLKSFLYLFLLFLFLFLFAFSSFCFLIRMRLLLFLLCVFAFLRFRVSFYFPSPPSSPFPFPFLFSPFSKEQIKKEKRRKERGAERRGGRKGEGTKKEKQK